MGTTVACKFTAMATRGTQRAAAAAAAAVAAGGSAVAAVPNSMTAAASGSWAPAVATRGIKRPRADASARAGGAKRKSGTRAPRGVKLGRTPDSERDELENLPCLKEMFKCFIGPLKFKVTYYISAHKFYFISAVSANLSVEL